MTRRTFVATSAAAGLFAPAAQAAPSNNMYLQLQYVMLRNGSQPERANAFFPKHYLAAAQRSGASLVGMFNAVIAPQSPFFLILQAFPTFEAIEAARIKLIGDAEFQKAADQYFGGSEPAFVRVDSSILRTFDGFPSVKPPEGPPDRQARIFELRTYESNDFHTLRKKIKMFNDGEAGIFQRLGMSPVFFGETIFGRNQPSLTYMLSFENLAAREQLWSKFGADPEWQKLRATPGLSDGEIVSNISNAILRPASNSQIR
jgi:NIPSNAP